MWKRINLVVMEKEYTDKELCEFASSVSLDAAFALEEKEKKKSILAVCDDCGRDILEDEVALMRGGIICYDCCLIRWGAKEPK